MSTDRVTPLLKMLQHEKAPEVFRVLVSSLLEYQDSSFYNRSDFPKITETFMEMLKDNPSVHQAELLLDALSYTRAPEARDAALDTASRSTNPSIVRVALRSLANKSHTKRIRDFILNLGLSHDEGSVRTEAYETLRVPPELGKDVASRIGPALISEENSRVRSAGLQALWKCGEAGNSYLEIISRQDPDASVRSSAQFWLKKPHPK